MDRKRQASKRDQGSERSIFNQTRDDPGFTVHQGSAGLSCRRFRQPDLSGLGTGLRLKQGRRERPPKLRTLENAPAMHQMGAGVTGVSLALRPGFKHCRTRSKHSQRSRPGLDASERIREASEAGPQGPPFSQREMEKNGIEMVRHRSVGKTRG